MAPGLTGNLGATNRACGQLTPGLRCGTWADWDGLAAGLTGLEDRRCCSVSVWESEEESETWASAVCSLSLARGSAHRLPGDLTWTSGADSDLTWLWRGKGQCEQGDEELVGLCVSSAHLQRQAAHLCRH